MKTFSAHRLYLKLLVFFGGLVILGAEMAASRLLAPYFGTSLMVWSSLIGLILVCLAVGYWVGGAYADRSPRLSTLLQLVAWGGFALALVPFVARPVLLWALHGFATVKLGLFFGSFVGVLALLSVPMVLLGGITPFAIRLSAREVEETGRVTGQLFALSTLGSFIGAFLPVMVLIPTWGTQRTYVLLGLAMLALAGVGGLVVRKARLLLLPLALSLAVLLLQWALGSRTIKPGEDLIYETESAYHYIQVLEDAQGWRSLKMNEGVATHSKYHPGTYFTGGEWDCFAAAPFFNPAPYDPATRARRWAVIGLGAGTTPRLVTEAYGPVHIEGVEIDPDVVAVGRAFFGMTQTNLHVFVQDGRSWLSRDAGRYDVVAIDAYRQPYIPFELTTIEFFDLVRAHLNDPGVVAINIARTRRDTRLVDALVTTMQQVFPSVFLLNLPHGANTIAVGTTQRATPEDYSRNIGHVVHPALRLITRRARDMIAIPTRTGMVLTDDRAPVERLMDLLVAREILVKATEGP